MGYQRLANFLNSSAVFPSLVCLTFFGAFFLEVGNAAPIENRTETRLEPRPLRIHVMQVNLTSKTLEPVVAIGNDPDADGPAEAELTNPLKLAEREGLIAAINANAWANLPESPDAEVPKFYAAGGSSNIVGWAVRNGVQRSAPQRSAWSFWIDTKGRGHIDVLGDPIPAKMAVAGFSGLVRNGIILPKEGGAIHPRTALGIDAAGRMLTFVVVDGRKPGTSEGMTLQELAQLMRELGCLDALNLDGGGSSIMIRDGNILNSPCDMTGPRPVPVMIGVRLRR